MTTIPVTPASGGNRATLAALEDIVGDVGGATVTAYLTAAHQLVEVACGSADYTEAQLTVLEAWLAAHFYTVYSPQVRAEAGGGVSDTFATGKLGQGLDSTMYGQQAKLLDPAGCLAQHARRAQAGKVATVTWLGTSSS